MADIDLQGLSPSALAADDKIVVRRGEPPTSMELVANTAFATAAQANATHTGDVTGSTALTIANDAVTNAKAANMATATIKGRVTAGTGDPEDLSAAQVRTLINVANGATANATDAALRDRSTHTGTQPAASISDFAEAVDDRVAVLAVAGVNMTITYNDVLGTLTFAAAGGGGSTNLSYDAPSREVRSDTGTDAVLPLMSSGQAGLVPASGGGTTNFLRADGTWAAPPGGGGGTGDVVGPASATDNAVARFDATTGKLIQNSVVTLDDNGQLYLPHFATPTVPPADTLGLFGRRLGGRMMPSFVGPSGLDTALQPLIGRNKVGWFQPAGNAVTTTQMGVAYGASGTATARNVAATNMYTRGRRISYVSAAAASAVCGIRNNTLQLTVGDGAGLGGFYYIVRFGFHALNADSRCFVGMRNSASAPTDVNPSTITNCFGFARIDGSTNFHFVHGGSAAQTPTNLGATFPANTTQTDVYEAIFFSPPGVANTVFWRLERKNTGDTTSGTLTGSSTVMPQSTTLIGLNTFLSTNTGTTAVAFDVFNVYQETDD